MTELDALLSKVVDETVNAAIKMTLDAVAEGFESLAREDIDGESGTITYRQVISALRGVTVPPAPVKP